MSDRKLQILVVDDEVEMRTLLHDFLISQGYQPRCFSSGSQALRILRQGDLPDAILTDIRMARMSGIDLLRIAHRDFPTIPVILFTAAGNPDEKIQSMMMGARDYFSKPFSLAELKASLEKIFLPPQISKRS